VTFAAADPDAYYAAGWQPPAPPRDPLAVAALVTGVLAVGPVALGLGIAALARTHRSGLRGRGFAVTGIVLGAAWTVILGTVVTAGLTAWQESRPLPAAISRASTAHVGQLVTGNCVESLPPDGDVARVQVVPCSTPHAAQVITDYRFTANTVWPGQSRVDERVAGACQISAAEQAAGVRVVTWAPTEASWTRGDRTGLCLATKPGGRITGSFLDGSVALP
jgi:Domain of unknown function (DUF4190)/Septum formation